MKEAARTARTVLVTGATGQQGGAVVRALLKRGHRVRGLTRSPDTPAARRLADRGAEVVAGDFTSADSLVRAAAGADAMFAVTTPFEGGVDAETAQGIALVAAARRAGVGHFVYSSVASADRATGIPHFDSKYVVEQAIARERIPCTIVAPVFFMDNLIAPWMAPGIAGGTLALAMPGTIPLQQIAVADIGAFAAAVIDRGAAMIGQRFDVAGDELTGDAAAAVLSKVTGHPVRYRALSPDALRQSPGGEDMALMYEWFAATGYAADIPALHDAFPEVAWQRFPAWARQQTWEAAAAPPV